MGQKRLIKISKYLSKHLRHQPQRIGIEIKKGGWTEIKQLLIACRKHGFEITLEQLEEVVRNNDKQRFSFDETKTLIRANQGHSIEVDLELQPRKPPYNLYHGTGETNQKLILQKGIVKMSRHHVHLSEDIETARKVGQRKGKTIIFLVNSEQMYAEGHEFYLTTNSVWLVEYVPPQYLQLIT